MSSRDSSIFRTYYTPQAFSDRYARDPQSAVDVVIPVLHTNELWETNLVSIYREIPVHRLLISDGGCVDDSIEIARKFPRTVVLDHRAVASLGYCIRKLIEAVETEWFIYLHSDVYLPEGWFDVMKKYQGQFDWYGCPMQHTVMVEYRLRDDDRPYAGSQIGRTAAFRQGLAKIDDDFVYRQEDFVFADIVTSAGYKEGKVEDTFHYHQTMHKPSPAMRRVRSVRIDVEMSREEQVRTAMTQAKGIVKYLDPSIPWLVNSLRASVQELQALGAANLDELRQWVAATNPAWLPYLSPPPPPKRSFAERLKAFLAAGYGLFRG